MAEDAELIFLVRQADRSLRQAMTALHVSQNKAVDAIGVLSLIDSGHLASAIAAIRVAVREFDGQLNQFSIAANDIDAYRRRLE